MTILALWSLWGWFEYVSMALGLPQYYTLHPHVRPDRRWCKCQLLWKKRWRPREDLKSAGRMPNSDAFSMATFNALDAGAHAVLTFIEYHRRFNRVHRSSQHLHHSHVYPFYSLWCTSRCLDVWLWRGALRPWAKMVNHCCRMETRRLWKKLVAWPLLCSFAWKVASWLPSGELT